MKLQQFTLAEMIKILENYPKEMKIIGISSNSPLYDNLYSKIVFKFGFTTVGQLLNKIEDLSNLKFFGFRGCEQTIDRSSHICVTNNEGINDLVCGFIQRYDGTENFLTVHLKIGRRANG